MPTIKQTSIFDWLDNQPKQSKRLVKSDLHTVDYKILDYLKQNALGAKNKVSGQHLAIRFGFDSTAKVRQHIKRLRVDPSIHLLIGSNNSGYWIPTEDEMLDAIKYKLNKAISEVETVINMYPRSAKIIQAVSGYVYKKVDKAPQGQLQIPFNGWEREFVNHYANKYLDEKESDIPDDELI